MASEVDESPAAQRASDSDDSDDSALLARVGAGDRAALKTLYVKYHPRLLRFIYRVAGHFELAQEGINDTMLVVWNRSHSFEGRSTVATWILGIAYRKALELRREAQRRARRQIDIADFEDWVERSAATESLTDTVDVRDLLARALRELPPEQCAVVELTYFYGCSYQEIAEIVGCPVNTVKTRMFHARRKLKALLPDLGQAGPEP